jgi:hypothetical protein
VLLRRAAALASTIAVAIIVAFAVPVAQLRTVSVVHSCCCPVPADCHCPEHDTNPPSQPSMRACHSTDRMFVAPQLPAFHAPEVVQAPMPTLVAIAVAYAAPAPHPAPARARPDAPS